MMKLLASFTVFGKAMPKGSGSRMANGAYLEGGTPLSIKQRKKWKLAVIDACANLVNLPLGGALYVYAKFWVKRPKSRQQLKEVYCTVKPDVDKLLRGLLDPMTHHEKRNPYGLLQDDSRVAKAVGVKLYTDSEPFTEVSVFRLLQSEPYEDIP